MSTFERIPRVTALPTANLKDGQVVIYDTASNGVEWQLQYTSSEATYKWRYIGGPPLFDKVGTSWTYNQRGGDPSGWGDSGGAAGATITLPLAGDYIIDFRANVYNEVAGRWVIVSYAINGTLTEATLDAKAAKWSVNAVSYATVTHSHKETGRAAGDVLQMKIRGTWPYWEMRSIKATPIRLG